MKKEYCCLQLEDMILKGSIRIEKFIHDKPEHDMYIAEIVTQKHIKNHWVFFKQEEIKTKEFILKNCIFCSKDLRVNTS